MKRVIYILAVILLTAALLFSGYQLWQYFTAEKETAEPPMEGLYSWS
jgi:hypothetical protein